MSAVASVARALYNWFGGDQSASSIYAALGGRLYIRGSAPPDTAWPYGVYQILDGRPDWAQDHTAETLSVQFSLFTDDDPDGAAADELLDKLRARYDHVELTFPGGEYRTIWCRPRMYTPAMPADPEETGDRRMVVAEYELWVAET